MSSSPADAEMLLKYRRKLICAEIRVRYRLIRTARGTSGACTGSGHYWLPGRLRNTDIGSHRRQFVPVVAIDG